VTRKVSEMGYGKTKLGFNEMVCGVEILRVEMSIRQYFVSSSDFHLRIFMK
jgi:hypothetical protein